MAAFSVLGGSLTLFDGSAGYRPSEDSFWLAALAPFTKGAICDVGCGTGAVGLGYLTTHQNIQSLWGFDVQPDMVHAANKAATTNDLNASFKVGDIAAPPFAPGSFALTLANPPFYNPEREMLAMSPHNKKSKFMHHPLSSWLNAMATLTNTEGQLSLIVHKKDENILIDQAATLGCTLTRAVTLKTAPEKFSKRVILQFVKTKSADPPKKETIFIYDKATRTKYLKEAP